MAKIQAIREDLPGIDCGACGSPTCRAFAEDIVLGYADINDCVIGYKNIIKEYIKAKSRGSLNNDGQELDGDFDF